MMIDGTRLFVKKSHFRTQRTHMLGYLAGSICNYYSILSRIITCRYQLKNYQLIKSNLVKNFSMAKLLKIGTHNGKFHCDECLACFMIKQVPRFKNSIIIRSRDPKQLSNCDIVVDVGGIYDHERLLFDHHQKSFDVTMKTIFPDKPFDIKLSSAGLIFAHFGHEIIANYNDWDKNDPRTDKIFDMMYRFFVKEIDAIDNGKFK